MSADRKSQSVSEILSSSASASGGPPGLLWTLKFVWPTAEGRATALFVVYLATLIGCWWCKCGCSWTSYAILTGAWAALSRYLSAGPKSTATTDLTGQTVIVTGGNTGIGKETVLGLARRGARVILACRDLKKGTAATADIYQSLKSQGTFGLAKTVGTIEVRELDLANLASVREFVSKFQDAEKNDCHILINNAGIGAPPYQQTVDRNELIMQTNHLGPMLLTVLLLPTLKRCNAKIVNVASTVHTLFTKGPSRKTGWKGAFSCTRAEYNMDNQYGLSKLANIMFTRTLAKKLEGTGCSVYVLHPGCVATDFLRDRPPAVIKFVNAIQPLFLKNCREGAETTLYCATDPAAVPVLFHSDCAVVESSPLSRNDASAAELWDESCRLLNIQA